MIIACVDYWNSPCIRHRTGDDRKGGNQRSSERPLILREASGILKKSWIAATIHRYKKHTGKPRISYNDAVEEALCFGWIDSTVRTIDEDRYAQRFSVRKPGSRYSQASLERIRARTGKGRVMADILKTIPKPPEGGVEVPPDILKAIQADRQAWKNFRRFSLPYIRIRIAFIDGARRRPAEFEKRLAHFIKMTAENRLFGFGGIDKYY
jgi:uncharacterized protein YdeI (YjbR/CyaY-like superfamily)